MRTIVHTTSHRSPSPGDVTAAPGCFVGSLGSNDFTEEARWRCAGGWPTPAPIIADDLLFRPEHSIIDQSLHAEMCGFTTNGDGFGIGWYDNDNSTTPGVFKGTHPAWNDENLREVATQIRTPLLFAHVRASSGTPVQR